MITRIIRRAINTAKATVLAQIEALADELRDDAEVFETFGFTACPPDDVTEGLCAYPNGDTGHPIIISWLDRKYRPRNLKPGELTIYSNLGQSIKLDADGQVVVTSASGSKITMSKTGDIIAVPSSGIMRLTGTLLVSQNITAIGVVTGMAGVKTATIDLGTHPHAGVTPGTSNTGLPVPS